MLNVGDNLAEALGVTKYEPPSAQFQAAGPKKKRTRRATPEFPKYTDIEHLNRWNRVLVTDEPLYITEKLHGTNARFARLYTPYVGVSGFLRRIKEKFTGRKAEYMFGTRNTRDGDGSMMYYKDNPYKYVSEAYGMESQLNPGEILYGEIIGPGIQKGYDYGLRTYHFFAFDIMRDGVYLDPT